MPVPPDHVCEAFQTPAETPIPLGHAWDNGTKIGDMVLSQAAPTALWSAKVRAGLSVEGARVARPILSTDGRYTVAGWKASAWSQGELLRRVDETALLGLGLPLVCGKSVRRRLIAMIFLRVRKRLLGKKPVSLTGTCLLIPPIVSGMRICWRQRFTITCCRR